MKDYPYDIGILGFWWGYNYGSLVTYYGLYSALRCMGYRVLMVYNPGINKQNLLERDHPGEFIREFYKDTYFPENRNALRQLNEKCNIFLVGSDQVWNYGISKKYARDFYLDFVNDEHKKLSYAASFGHNIIFEEEQEKEVTGELLSRFEYISVREKDAVQIVNQTFKLKAKQVLDPVFLENELEFANLAERSKKKRKSGYVAAYILDPTPEKKAALEYIAKTLDKEIVCMLDGMPGSFEENKRKMNLDCVIQGLLLEDWLYFIKNCDYFFTDSCHGASLAIVFKRPFICIGNTLRGMSRFYSLFDMLKLQCRLFFSVDDIYEKFQLLEEINYTEVDRILEKEKYRSKKWLKHALEVKKIGDNKYHKSIFYLAKRAVRKILK